MSGTQDPGATAVAVMSVGVIYLLLLRGSIKTN